MSTISASTTSTTAYKVTADTTGALVFQTGATPTTAMTLGADQSVTFAGTPTYSGGTANGVAYLNGSKVLTTGSALVFDGSNLGLGVTPSATVAGSLFVKRNICGTTTTPFVLYYNSTLNASETADTYINTGSASRYYQNSGAHYWSTAPSGTAGSAVTFTQIMLLDASGNLTATGTGNPTLTVNSTAGAYTSILKLQAAGGGASVINATGASSDALLFQITGSEKARIDSSGNFSVGTTGIPSSGQSGSITSSTVVAAKGPLQNHTTNAGIFEYSGNKTSIRSYGGAAGSGYIAFNVGGGGGSADFQAAILDSTGVLKVTSSASGSIQVDTTSAGTNSEFQLRRGNTARWFIWNDGSTNRLNITPGSFSSGVYLTDTATAWAAYSDRRIKSNIVDLDLGLSTVMAIQPRRYTLIANGLEDLGFVAQELQQVLPEAVVGQEVEFDENDSEREKSSKLLGITRDTIIPVLVKAIQEQQAIIQQLQADVATLKGAA